MVGPDLSVGLPGSSFGQDDGVRCTGKRNIESAKTLVMVDYHFVFRQWTVK